MKKRTFKTLSQQDFDIIKQLLRLNIKPIEIRRITTRANSTIDLISKSEDMDGYKKLLQEIYKRKSAYKAKSDESYPFPFKDILPLPVEKKEEDKTQLLILEELCLHTKLLIELNNTLRSVTLLKKNGWFSK